jgi:hypothetical protein
MLKPLIATPCYGGMLCENYVASIVKLEPMPDFFFPACSLITKGRNACVARFLKGDWSHLFFIDSDIGFTPAEFYRLLSSGYDVAAAPYPFKSDNIDVQRGFVVDPTELAPVREDGFALLLNAPTGFMCIKRSVIETMAAAGIGPNEFFDTMRDEDRYYGEDHAFCKRWRDLGGFIHLDTRADLTHQGTKLYRKDFAAAVKETRNNGDNR